MPEFSKNIVRAAIKNNGLNLNEPEFLKNFKKNIELYL
jgi:hypothetical protein